LKNKFFFLCIVLIFSSFLPLVPHGNADNKSLYVISNMHGVDISAWELQGSPNYMVHQTTTTGLPDQGGGAVGLAIDGDSGILFVTYEFSNTIQLLNARTMEDEGTTTASGAGDLAGIVYDGNKDKVYSVDRGTNDLYVYDWDASTKTLTADPNNPLQLEYSGAYGIALDETNNYLYVTSNSVEIYYYDTGDFSGTGTINALGSYSMPNSATSVAVDPIRDLLYSGDGFNALYGSGTDKLDQYNLTDDTTSSTDVYPSGSDQGVIGLDVDLDTGYVYITTGRQSGSYHHLKAYDTSLSLLDDETQDLGKPTDIAIPSGEISYSPLSVSKDDGVTGSVDPGDTITYTINYDNVNPSTVHNVGINDTLSVNVTFNSASDGGSYDPDTHSVFWDLGDLTSGDSGSVTLTVTVNPGTWGTTIHNNVTIDSDETDPYSSSEDTSVTDASPPIADADGPYTGDEGSPITFNASDSSDPDGTIDSYEWDWDNDGSYDESTTSPTITHTWSDDHSGTIGLKVTDNQDLSDIDTAKVTVNNVAPTADAGPDQTVDEGDTVNFEGNFTDPGWLDTHTATWDWGDGTGDPGVLTEENNPPDSTGNITGSNAYGDNGVYTVNLTVSDDDGGVDWDTASVNVNNLPPVITDVELLEIKIKCDNVFVKFRGNFTDPGWLDTHNATWDWGDATSSGVVVEENTEPDATGVVTGEHTYTDAKFRNYTVTLTVMDDDGDTDTYTYSFVDGPVGGEIHQQNTIMITRIIVYIVMVASILLGVKYRRKFTKLPSLFCFLLKI